MSNAWQSNITNIVKLRGIRLVYPSMWKVNIGQHVFGTNYIDVIVVKKLGRRLYNENTGSMIMNLSVMKTDTMISE